MSTTRARGGVRVIIGAAALVTAAVTGPAPARAHAATDPGTFSVGLPTVVDPIRGVGEPDILVDNNNNPMVTGPGGSSAATSFFWYSKDGGLTYPLLGPANGHMICPASGGGDSLGTIDHATNQIYLVDQESLADLGFGTFDPKTGAVSAGCANNSEATADRPFEGVLSANSAAPQSRADSGKPLVYLSFACQACGEGANNSGLAFGWTDDGLTWHPADPGVTGDNTATNTFQEGGALSGLEWHGPTVVDPTTGYVFTAISCNQGSGCPDVSYTQNTVGSNAQVEMGVAVGVPYADPKNQDSGNLGQFQRMTYVPACINEVGCQEEGSLFPVIGMDSNHTLYEMWTEGNGFGSTTATPGAADWHIWYTYSLDSAADHHMHTQWSQPVQVDTGMQTATMGWMAVGDPGHLGFIWLGDTQMRAHPSAVDKDVTGNPGVAGASERQWHVFMSETTDGLSATPTFQQSQVGLGPNHIGDICLQGTVGCIETVGNRNMADFISVDIGPDGALQGTWANDANQLATLPTTLIPGLPLTETARQVSGPRLRGTGDVQDSRFDPTPTSGTLDPVGDATFNGTNVPQLDLTGSQITFDGQNVVVTMNASDLSSLASPDTTNQTHVWWLTTWQFQHKIWFAKAESDSGGAITCTAGAPASYDRPALNAQTGATLVDYQGGTAVSGCTQSGNSIRITVPANLVGNPANGDLLETASSYTALDNGQKPYVTSTAGNIPTIVDITPAYNAGLGVPGSDLPESPLAPALIMVGIAAAGSGVLRRRIRR